jgi:hypothetical protein
MPTSAEIRCRQNIDSVIVGEEVRIVWSGRNDYSRTEIARAEAAVKDSPGKWLSRIALAVGTATTEERVQALESG